ncbi:hypothetical protein KAH94_02470, partial [bacterium]|nr:hypothetical protein [bacterium]
KLKEKLTRSFLDFQEEVEKKLKQKVDLFFEKKVSGTEKLIPFFEKKVRVFFEQLIDSYIKKASTKEEKEKFLQAKNININGALQLFFTVNDHFSGSKEEVLSYYNTIKKFSKISKNLHK